VIPRDIYVTWKSKDLSNSPLWMQRYLAGWQSMNPGFTFHLCDDADCEALFHEVRDEVLAELGIDVLDLYHRLEKQVEKTDLWRYLVIYMRGGLYTDADTACLVPCEKWILPTDRVIVGFERFKCEHPTQYCQWTFAAEARHPFLGLVLRRVSESIQSVRGTNRMATLSRTGPIVFTDALIEFIELNGGRFKEVVNQDCLVTHGLHLLPQIAFSGGLVYHRFAGTWKHWLHRPGWFWRFRNAGRDTPKES
jgi:mannosyltransferase OCH1-like enzyme